MMILVDEADALAPRHGAGGLAHAAAILAADDDTAVARPFQQAGNVQQRRLARAGRAEQGHDLAALYGKVDAAQHLDALAALAEGTADILQAEHVRHGALHPMGFAGQDRKSTRLNSSP